MMSFDKNHDYLKINSILLQNTSGNQYDIYVINDSLLMVMDPKGQEILTNYEIKEPEKWKRAIKIFARFGILIE